MLCGVPPGFVSGLLPFNIFVGNMDNGIECTLSKSHHYSKLCVVVDILAGRNANQRNLDRLQGRSYANHMKFNKIQCKVLHLGQGLLHQ